MCATVGLPNVNVGYLGQHVAERGGRSGLGRRDRITASVWIKVSF